RVSQAVFPLVQRLPADEILELCTGRNPRQDGGRSSCNQAA
ncbi:uncharacterized protein METZ01_LOCUS279862, partial [marine metagenome]